MPTNLDEITLALALTAGGAVVFAGLITGVIQLFKSIPGIPVAGHERLLAFILSGIAVVAAMAAAVQAATLTIGIDSVFAGLLAWYGIARASMAIYDDVTGNASSLRA